MADKPQGRSVEQNSANAQRRKKMAMGGILLGVMAVEAVVVVVLVKQFAGPATAEAVTPHGVELAQREVKPQEVELEVVRLRAQNERSQRQMTYDLDVYISVLDSNKDKVEKTLQRRKATVQDRLSRLVRAAEPERFTEPDLRTLRKQFKAELTQIAGEEGVILEVLIPSIVASED